MLKLASAFFVVGLAAALLGFTAILGLVASIHGWLGADATAVIGAILALSATAFLVFQVFHSTSKKIA